MEISDLDVKGSETIQLKPRCAQSGMAWFLFNRQILEYVGVIEPEEQAKSAKMTSLHGKTLLTEEK